MNPNDESTEDGLWKDYLALPPEKAAAILPGFKANIAQLKEARRKQFNLLDQIVFHVTLKAHGVDGHQVRNLIRGHVWKRRRLTADGKSEPYEADAIDWKTGSVDDRYSVLRPYPTGQVVGVVLKDGRVIKFTDPCPCWN